MTTNDAPPREIDLEKVDETLTFLKDPGARTYVKIHSTVYKVKPP